MLFAFLLTSFILVCIFLCFLVLIQNDKGGGISGAIGGLSGANNFLGTQDTASVLTKGTYIFGAVFLILCVLMTFTAPGSGQTRSAMERRAERVQSVTATPASGFGMDFAEEALESGGPTIIGDIIEGGTILTVGEDGELRPVETKSVAGE